MFTAKNLGLFLHAFTFAPSRFFGLSNYMRLAPDLKWAPELASALQSIPVRPCFALMLAFKEPLTSVSYPKFVNVSILACT